MTFSHLHQAAWLRGLRHGGLIVGISWDCSLFLFIDRFIGTVPNLVLLCIISNVPDINLLYDLSSVVPGEVLTSPCSLGFGIQCLWLLVQSSYYKCLCRRRHCFRSYSWKISFFSTSWLETLIMVLLSAVVILIHWPYSAKGLEYYLWFFHRVFFLIECFSRFLCWS